MSEFDDLLGTAPTPAPSRATERQRRAEEKIQEAARLQEIRLAGSGKSRVKVQMLMDMPVSMNWLAEFFGRDPTTIRKRLKDCKPAGVVGAGREVYMFHEAIPYLVDPKMTPEQFVKTLNKAHLPPEINNAFWAAQRNRVRYKLEAQEAWDTEDILSFLGEIALSLKDGLTMAVEEMRARAKLTDEQAALFEQMLDEMRNNIAEKLLEIPERRETKSLADKPLFGTGKDEIDDYPVEVEDDE